METRQATRKRIWWTKAEDKVLQEEADIQLNESGNVKDWSTIASKLPGRTNKDCRKRWSKVRLGIRKGAWSPEEDAKLQKAVAQDGFKWAMVAGAVKTRNADQCAKRWQHVLEPDLNHSPWTSEEDRVLEDSMARYGNSWKRIGANALPNRSPHDIRSRSQILRRRSQRLTTGTPESPENCEMVTAEDTVIHDSIPSINDGNALNPNDSKDEDDDYVEDYDGDGQEESGGDDDDNNGDIRPDLSADAFEARVLQLGSNSQHPPEEASLTSLSGIGMNNMDVPWYHVSSTSQGMESFQPVLVPGSNPDFLDHEDFAMSMGNFPPDGFSLEQLSEEFSGPSGQNESSSNSDPTVSTTSSGERSRGTVTVILKQVEPEVIRDVIARLSTINLDLTVNIQNGVDN